MIRKISALTVIGIACLWGGCSTATQSTIIDKCSDPPEIYQDSLDSNLPAPTWQEVRLGGEYHDLLYRIELVAPSTSRVGIRLYVKNLGDSPVLILLDHGWDATYSGGNAAVSSGEPTGTYGSEIPAFTILPPDQCALESSWVDLAPELWEGKYLEVGFYGISDRNLILQLTSLETVNGWWQTDDLELTKRYYDSLVYSAISFTVTKPVVEESGG